jgi:hypothetical protein
MYGRVGQRLIQGGASVSWTRLGKLDYLLVIRLSPLLLQRVPIVFAQAVHPVGDVELWGPLKAHHLGLGIVASERQLVMAVFCGDIVLLQTQG